MILLVRKTIYEIISTIKNSYNKEALASLEAIFLF